MFRRFARAAGAAVVTALAGASVFLSSACTSASAPSKKIDFQVIDVRVGTGAAASTGSTLSVKYVGYLYDETNPEKKGEVFDASLPDRPFVFWLGTNQVIAGWDEGLVGMKVGGLRRLIVPSTLGYGRGGAGNRIPPNAALVFDIELLSVF